MAGFFDKNTLAKPIHQLRRRLLNYAVALIKHYEQAEDLVQEALEVSLRKDFDLVDNKTCENYLKGVIYKRFLMWYRKKQKEVLYQSFPDVEDEDKEELEKLKSVAIEKVLEVVRGHKDGRLVEAIYLNGEKTSTLAKQLNIKYASLMKRKERALKEIYRILKAQTPPEDP